MTRYAVNCSIIFTELPLNERAAAAKAAGFDAVEFWWPWTVATPPAVEVSAFVEAIAASGCALIGLNFWAGDMPAGDRGMVSNPARVSEFRESVDIAMEIARATGCRAFNALYGNRIEGVSPAEQDAVAVDNLAYVGRAVADLPGGGLVLVEPLSGAPAYPLTSAEDALAVIERVRTEHSADNLRLLLDQYHLEANGHDALAAWRAHRDQVGHVQIADVPGRGQPGTGEYDMYNFLSELGVDGWTGYVALEYKPVGPSAESFGFFDHLAG